SGESSRSLAVFGVRGHVSNLQGRDREPAASGIWHIPKFPQQNGAGSLPIFHEVSLPGVRPEISGARSVRTCKRKEPRRLSASCRRLSFPETLPPNFQPLRWGGLWGTASRLACRISGARR